MIVIEEVVVMIVIEGDCDRGGGGNDCDRGGGGGDCDRGGDGGGDCDRGGGGDRGGGDCDRGGGGVRRVARGTHAFVICTHIHGHTTHTSVITHSHT